MFNNASAWLLAHNNARESINNGIDGQPIPNPALPAFVWDDDFAQVGQDYLIQYYETDHNCPSQLVHSTNESRKDAYTALNPDNTSWVGENMARRGISYTEQEIVASWLAEHQNYNGEQIPGDNSSQEEKDKFQNYGHYTQLAWRNTTRVGCGVFACNSQTVVACNYSAA